MHGAEDWFHQAAMDRANSPGMNVMDDNNQSAAIVTALTTEHFVLQTATSTTYTEAAARSSLYVMALSSALVATGFMANSPDVLFPFLATVLPAVFLLGLFTVARLVETGLESMHYLDVIARIRGVYRTLGPGAADLFSQANGRWPEAKTPALRLGALLAFMGTTASMIAVINNVVGGAFIALLVHALGDKISKLACASTGLVGTVALTWMFYSYQRWRFAEFDNASPINE